MSSPLSYWREWHLEVECSGERCPVGRAHPVDRLERFHPGATVSDVIDRLKCAACGAASTSAVLTDAAQDGRRKPGRRLALRGPECRY
jgi:hypothetical protein